MKHLKPLSILLFALFAMALLPNKTFAQETKHPLVLVNGFQTEMNSLILDKAKIKSMNVFKDTAATNRYGKRGVNGVILIKTEPVNFMRLNALLNRFHVADSVRKLRVTINGSTVKNTEWILADESNVESINAVEENGEMVLNIKTKKRNE
jgi:TonB-dependent SusC/RagA subfamily outer membrane receptor